MNTPTAPQVAPARRAAAWKTFDPQIINLLYRCPYQMMIQAFAAGISLALIIAYNITPLTIVAVPVAVLCTMSTAVMCIIRLIYRLNPYCPVCGLDAVDCKMNRRSLSEH